MSKITGLHIIGDLYECDFTFFINKYSTLDLRKILEDKVQESSLTIMGSILKEFYHTSFSLNIMLAESHICIHTWPEEKYVSLDVFVCNYTKDNSEIAKNIFEDIKCLFASKKEKIQLIER
jgi:S-adenosylmethionine decarboxylase